MVSLLTSAFFFFFLKPGQLHIALPLQRQQDLLYPQEKYLPTLLDCGCRMSKSLTVFIEQAENSAVQAAALCTYHSIYANAFSEEGILIF